MWQQRRRSILAGRRAGGLAHLERISDGRPEGGHGSGHGAWADASKVSANIVNLKIGARVSTENGGSLYVGHGKHPHRRDVS